MCIMCRADIEERVAVNLAARMCQNASDGKICISPAFLHQAVRARDLGDDDVCAHELEAFQFVPRDILIKGFGTMTVHDVVRGGGGGRVHGLEDGIGEAVGCKPDSITEGGRRWGGGGRRPAQVQHKTHHREEKKGKDSECK